MSKKKEVRVKKPKSNKKRGVYNYVGLWSGTAFFAVSMLPSLLPRPWLFQAIISGFSLAVGYGVGVFISFVIRWMLERPLPTKATTATKAWKLLHVVAPIVIVASSLLGVTYQNEVRRLAQQSEISILYAIPVLVVAVVLAVGVIGLSRATRKQQQKLSLKLRKYVPARVSVVISLVIAVLLFSWVASGFFEIFFVNQTNRIYNARNNSTPEGVSVPTSTYRSGSPESIFSWDSVGFQGKRFVSGGPTTTQLKEFTKSDSVKESVRVYAGVNSASTTAERSRLAVEELKRTGAFSRKVLVIANVTGTGWLEPQTIDALEYMYGGDTAIVAQQYSYLPSWISFLVDKTKATETGASLFDAVHSEWAKLPKETRPKLISYGLSLGSFSGQSAFAGVNDLRLSTNGALFVGTPSDTMLWKTITANRDAGSPQVLPIYQNGQAVHFATSKETINNGSAQWQSPRVLYLQHASDPVVWFDFSLITQKPDWLSEPRGAGVSANVKWYPFVTFAQVAVDQFFGTTVPNGHGYNYPDIIVDAWAAVVPPQDWTAEKSQTLQRMITTYPTD